MKEKLLKRIRSETVNGGAPQVVLGSGDYKKLVLEEKTQIWPTFLAFY